MKQPLRVPTRTTVIAIGCDLHCSSERTVMRAPVPDARARVRFADEERARGEARHPPVPLAEQPHQRRHEQRADHGRVEDDPRREPDPELLDVDAGARREHEEREHQHERRARHELARAREPERDRALRVAGLVVGLAHAREHEDLVVHREPVEEREDHQRDPRDDRLRRVHAPDRLGAVALLEDEDDDPVGRRERDEVEDRPPSAAARASGTRAPAG